MDVLLPIVFKWYLQYQTGKMSDQMEYYVSNYNGIVYSKYFNYKL